MPSPSPTPSLTPIPGESYGSLLVLSAPTDRPAAQNADLNLSLRGWASTQSFLGLVDYAGAVSTAPQLYGLFADNRTPTFKAVYQVYSWDWGCNCRSGLIDDWDVTLAGFAVSSGETIYTPDSGADIGNGYRALVLYADPERITLKYTRDDNVVFGYTIHIEGISVDSNLIALYQRLNSAGRRELPALQARQAMGRAPGNEIKLAIRDAGAFMDPRSRKDWWRGR